MRPISRAWVLVLAAYFVLVILCLWILGWRILSTIQDSQYAQSTGAEAPGLYGIYKVWLGEPLYQPLDTHPTTMLFNWLFYLSYGLTARFLVDSPENLPLFTRWMTLTIAVMALAGWVYFLRSVAKELSPEPEDPHTSDAPAILFAIVAVLGPFTGWWLVTARPDVTAVALELVGVCLFLSVQGKSVEKACIATVVFWLAWSFKQVNVFAFAGVLLVWAMERRWPLVGTSLLLFGLLSALPVVLFGPAYIEHAFVAPAVSLLRLSQASSVAKDVALTGCYVWIPLLGWLSTAAGRSWLKNLRHNPQLVILAVALAGSLLMSAKVGSSRNYYFTPMFIGALFVSRQVLSVRWSGGGFSDLKIVSGLSLGQVAGVLLAALYVAFPNVFGRVNLLTTDQRLSIHEAIRVVQEAPKPAFVEPAYLALPWNAGQYPSDVVDWGFYWVGTQRGIKVASIEARIARREYATAFVSHSHWVQLLETAGYKRSGSAGELIYFAR